MSRALSTVVGVVVLALVAVLAATVVGTALPRTAAEPTPVVDLRLDVDATANRLTIRHAGGDDLDVTGLRFEVQVGDERLAHQPPVPFFAARGYVSGPTGPFNPAGGTSWRAGQVGTLTLASTNRPLPASGDRVTVTVATDRGVVAELSTTAT